MRRRTKICRHPTLAAAGDPSLEACVVKDLGTRFEQQLPETVQRVLELDIDLKGNSDSDNAGAKAPYGARPVGDDPLLEQSGQNRRRPNRRLARHGGRVAMPDAVMGERSCAFVILKPGQSLTLSQLVGFLEEKQIAKFKLPERLEIVHSFPLSGMGKVSKKDLRDIIAAKLSSTLAKILNGLALDRGAKYGVNQFFTVTAKPRQQEKSPSICLLRKCALPCVIQIGQSRAKGRRAID